MHSRLQPAFSVHLISLACGPSCSWCYCLTPTVLLSCPSILVCSRHGQSRKSRRWRRASHIGVNRSSNYIRGARLSSSDGRRALSDITISFGARYSIGHYALLSLARCLTRAWLSLGLRRKSSLRTL